MLMYALLALDIQTCGSVKIGGVKIGSVKIGSVNIRKCEDRR